jgi:hypothetical protein
MILRRQVKGVSKIKRKKAFKNSLTTFMDNFLLLVFNPMDQTCIE